MTRRYQFSNWSCIWVYVCSLQLKIALPSSVYFQQSAPTWVSSVYHPPLSWTSWAALEKACECNGRCEDFMAESFATLHSCSVSTTAITRLTCDSKGTLPKDWLFITMKWLDEITYVTLYLLKHPLKKETRGGTLWLLYIQRHIMSASSWLTKKTSPVTGYHAELWALVSRLALETMQQWCDIKFVETRSNP